MTRIIGIDLGTTNSCVAVLDDKGQPRTLAAADGERTTPVVGARGPRNGDVERRDARAPAGGDQRVGDGLRREAADRPQGQRRRRRRGSRGSRRSASSPRPTATRGCACTASRSARRRSLRTCCAGCARSPRRRSASRSRARSSPCRRTSTTPSARRRATPARSPASTSCASSTSRPRPRSPTAPTACATGRRIDRRVRPRRRHVRRLDHVGRERHLRGARDRRRQRARRRGLGPPHARAHRRRGVRPAPRRSHRQSRWRMSRLREACESAKKTLSAESETMIQLPFLANDQHGAPINYERRLTRDEVEHADAATCSTGSRPRASRALADAGLDASEIEEVLLVGGMTRWPAVQARRRADLRQEAVEGREPRRGRRARRGRVRRASSPATPTTPRCSTSRRTTSASRSATRGSR